MERKDLPVPVEEKEMRALTTENKSGCGDGD